MLAWMNRRVSSQRAQEIFCTPEAFESQWVPDRLSFVRADAFDECERIVWSDHAKPLVENS